ncbi:hypothetical protein [Klebsiella spallanzanii]|uniref:Tail spike TSP1/Gp66 N-terminal domain-containing protein n=1 Tax=Klebsiella spallanzanii TaxID=2587528 RepID=A0A564HVV1_9ENTR|nr:hypothetical protein [Klebsiella spallanzanii]VUS37462.1 hypothetical protein SB6408_03186 [Klebsiella spallanzanii]
MADNEKLGSTSPQVLLKNAINLDKLVNDRESESLPDRFAVLRRTWYGMEKSFSRFIDYITGRGEQAVAAIGWQELGDWAIGLTVQNRNQIVGYNGSWYKYLGELEHVITGDSPENDGGVWSAENPTGKWSNIGDAALRSNLGSSDGDPIVAPEKVRLATVDDDSDFPLNAVLADVLSDVNPRMWKDYVVKGATKDEDDWSEAIQKAINYAHKKNKKFVNNESYGISKPIELPFPITIEFLNKCGSWYALPGFEGDMVKSKGAPEGDYMSLISPASESNGIFIRNMTLFGGWISDELTPSYTGVRDGLRLFGVQNDLDNIKVLNVRGKGYNLGGRSSTSVKGMAPSDYSRLRADWCGEEAFIFGGSSDSHADRIKVRDAGQLSNATYKAIRIGQGGTLRADKFHVWNSSTAKWICPYISRRIFSLTVAIISCV